MLHKVLSMDKCWYPLNHDGVIRLEEIKNEIVLHN